MTHCTVHEYAPQGLDDRGAQHVQAPLLLHPLLVAQVLLRLVPITRRRRPNKTQKGLQRRSLPGKNGLFSPVVCAHLRGCLWLPAFGRRPRTPPNFARASTCPLRRRPREESAGWRRRPRAPSGISWPEAPLNKPASRRRFITHSRSSHQDLTQVIGCPLQIGLTTGSNPEKPKR